MTGKKDIHLYFEVALRAPAGMPGFLSAESIPSELPVAPPVQFNGVPGYWSPEQLLLAAVSSCYMATFFSFVHKFRAEVKDFRCNVIGQAALEKGSYHFVRINIYPEIFLPDEKFRSACVKAAGYTQKHCLVANSLDCDIIYHTAIKLSSSSYNETSHT